MRLCEKYNYFMHCDGIHDYLGSIFMDVISRLEVWVCRSTVMSIVYIEVHCSGNCVKLISSVSSARHNMVVCEIR
jgi:hypothetical protein